ncbi:MAG: hypothetical protein UT19_C0012G0029 [Candidatus Woesebacteria bacterium GW2011_GWB1_39_10b]|uniref:Deoxynucleoside kinase domain-containing protein n=3 Tax=Candidatus Woeseibacteriota TaxID=1752722 RepID=A0A0G0NF22_9BACT|nr:MAG: hypothetical protein US72_C0013G0008 [Microgenomates group bacterium GW2011_GWC1_38_12]KKQ93440.1 MAG: hypothetical protein UT19_C0012G0029 [Candidatus Woesebacteria bacterium GW2011_GWB1_39_10b]KKR11426.1 MAG: hypothetical protein UT40_C0036G0002 [Candidatus Woesebacteria bacterium GW2011_GWA1_39_21b]OGM63139.1 MAG: hypothetical protein A3A52_03500 [Candidatus Woesebacteria bacterium RIFCSPLOWO2_01_FULL_39_14]
MKNDRDFRGGSDAEQVYKEYAGTVLPYLGWPAWPPKEVPQSSEWYKKPIYVLPKYPHMPQACFIGLDGTPHAGKTSLADSLAKKYVQSSNHTLHKINPDDLYVQGADGIMYVAISQIFPTLEDELPVPMEKNDWYTNLWHQFNKQLFWENRIYELIRTAKLNETRLVLGQRSPIDQTVFSYSLATHNSDPDFSIPEDFKELAYDLYLKTVIGSQTLVQFVDAEVFVGTDKKQSQIRRKAMGVTSKGIAGSPFFNDLSAWYGYWIENVWPKLYDLHGTGLLVLDGTKPIEENTEILLKYVKEANKRCLVDITR